MHQHGDPRDADERRTDHSATDTRAKRSRGFFRAGDDSPVLITEAAPSLEEQHRARVRRYTVIMAFRIPCLLGAALAYSLWANALISLLIIAVSVPLPWIAVLIANDRPPRTKDEPSRWDQPRPALESGPHRALE
ncbi:DUF3099 domain-containing protein [Nocardia asteroides]|uniref:DUF3099 domain-containing protein n=1 Tax=Nocardia asteroides TaxID=1824 RepID=UPI001E499C1F|nr:DUF3099 domain-containing protein [Nocardia asteroides]UGT63465.1 DUF3099 domain-containing protein [Nocardia asteroides]